MKSVTQLLWQIFVYDNKFFLQSLSKGWIKKKKIKWEIVKWWIADRAGYINYQRLMDTLTSFWSSIHLYAYWKWTWLWRLELPDFYQPYTVWLDRFFDRYKVRTIAWEKLVRTDEYSGTFDALLELTLPWAAKPVIVLADYKTWKYYKDFYWIENRVIKKDWTPYWEAWSLKKVRLQSSMYKDWYDNCELAKKYPVDHLAVIRITRLWTYMQLLDYDITEYTRYKNKLNWITNTRI